MAVLKWQTTQSLLYYFANSHIDLNIYQNAHIIQVFGPEVRKQPDTGKGEVTSSETVSYTHLDVYKRQVLYFKY